MNSFIAFLMLTFRVRDSSDFTWLFNQCLMFLTLLCVPIYDPFRRRKAPKTLSQRAPSRTQKTPPRWWRPYTHLEWKQRRDRFHSQHVKDERQGCQWNEKSCSGGACMKTLKLSRYTDTLNKNSSSFLHSSCHKSEKNAFLHQDYLCRGLVGESHKHTTNLEIRLISYWQSYEGWWTVGGVKSDIANISNSFEHIFYSIKRLWAWAPCGNDRKQCFVLLLLLLLFVVSSDFSVSSAVGNVAAVSLFLFLHNNVDSCFLFQNHCS